MAIIMMLIICIVGVESIAAHAVSISVASGLSYDVEVEKTGDKQLVLHLYVNNSLSLEEFECAVYTDSKCTITGAEVPGFGVCSIASDGQSAYIVTLFRTEKTGDFTIDIYIKTSDSADNTHTFSTVVTRFEATTKTYEAKSGLDVTVSTSDSYVIGDVDNDGKIMAVDATYVLNTISGGWTTVEKVNNNIATVRKNVCATIVCGEALDANHDKKVDSSDSNAILLYYANKNVNSSYEDDWIGREYYVLTVA